MPGEPCNREASGLVLHLKKLIRKPPNLTARGTQNVHSPHVNTFGVRSTRCMQDGVTGVYREVYREGYTSSISRSGKKKPERRDVLSRKREETARNVSFRPV